MRNLSQAAQSALNEEVLFFVVCVRIVRTDGEIIRLTEHNEEIQFRGETYEPGGTPSTFTQDLGFSTDSIDFDSITGDYLDDLRAGRFSGAWMEVFWVDWRTSIGFDLTSGWLGELQRDGTQVGIQFNSLSENMERPQGRFYNRGCDAQFGDHRCRVANFETRWRVEAAISSIDGKVITTDGSGGLFDEVGRFENGWLEMLEGRNAGIRREVVAHDRSRVQILFDFPFPLQSGERVRLTAGCRRDAAACQAYGNFINYRGFPDIPGDEFLGEAGNDPCNESVNRTMTSEPVRVMRPTGDPDPQPDPDPPQITDQLAEDIIFGRRQPDPPVELPPVDLVPVDQLGNYEPRDGPPVVGMLPDFFDRPPVADLLNPDDLDAARRTPNIMVNPAPRDPPSNRSEPDDSPYSDFSRQPARSPTDFQYGGPSNGGDGGGKA